MDENLYIFQNKHLKAPKLDITVVLMLNFNFIALKIIFFHGKMV